MSVTGTQVLTQVDGSIPNNALFTPAQRLAAINSAIVFGWPSIKNVKQDTSVTLAGTTYEYTPSATDVTTELGFAQGYVSNGSYNKILMRRLRQRQNQTTWKIIVPSDIASAYSGETLTLLYNARIATIAATTESIEMPLDYLYSATCYFLCLAALNKANAVDAKQWEPLTAQYEKMKETALLRNRGGDLQHMIPRTSELGVPENDGQYSRYGGQVLA